jgi:hypothetical protein
MSNNYQVRQGDVYLERISDVVPDGAVKQRDKNKIVLAFGEATGHHHRVSTKNATRYEWQGAMVVEIKKASKLLHEEHDPITLEPGVWKRTLQREYHPAEIRQVRD